MASNFKSSLTITHIGTATAIIDIGGIKFLTDPFFSPAGNEWDLGIVLLKNSVTPAVAIESLPPIDAVLLSHEDHPDNLDELGRRILDGRHVLTTPDGATKLAPRPGVRAIQPWETITWKIAGKEFEVTGTPCKHLPGGECTGFVITADGFGVAADGKPNAIYISGDTVYIEELRQITERWNVLAAVLHFGKAEVSTPQGILQLTMDGKQGARLFRELGADILIPVHFDSWEHFAQHGEALKKELEDEGVSEKVLWLEPGKATKVL
ncbi:putative Zn-dependent hydrolases of the beta-lactamase protein [Aspergillus pseudodeflectus]|uniref:Zn-dependent hydrolases of the beta-lactamase protein n=1 Tax=Aspergillus pseudodeflectus TaxID=176178 RepID=A0ABR4JY29_9EURO